MAKIQSKKTGLIISDKHTYLVLFINFVLISKNIFGKIDTATSNCIGTFFKYYGNRADIELSSPQFFFL